ncbi:MAG: S41 family peptidase [Chitinophagaceae bacterium]
MKTSLILAGFTGLLFIFSCKKNSSADNSNTPPAQGTDEEKYMDSVYLYSQEVYYWNSVLPSYAQFNPRQYKGSDAITSASNVMDAIKKLEPLDRYSFVVSTEESSGIQTGATTDWGFFVKAYSIDNVEPLDSVYWYVNYVYSQSNAGTSGVKRGWRINKIDGTQLGYDQASVDILNNIFFGTGTSASFEFLKPDGTTSTLQLSQTAYQSNSVLYTNVFNSGSGKIGYMVFNQFFGASSRVELTNVFNQFQAAGINDLIVDLRYNRGGATDTQDTLSDFIAPSSATNQKMYTYEFNEQLQQGNFPLLKRLPDFQNTSFAEAINTVYFKKAGGVNLSRVFFIVSNSTASASELTINNLRPYMDVKLIGDTTYGKPVGFFPITISDFDIYPISFRTINSVGSADYYSGFAPDKLQTDGVDKDWGDVTEPCLAEALKYISSGSFRTLPENDAQALRKQAQLEMKPVQKLLEEKKFTGMYLKK